MSEVTQLLAVPYVPGNLVQKPLPPSSQGFASYGQMEAVITKDFMSSLNQSHIDFYLAVTDKPTVRGSITELKITKLF